jgi:hypothetical protein
VKGGPEEARGEKLASNSWSMRSMWAMKNANFWANRVLGGDGLEAGRLHGPRPQHKLTHPAVEHLQAKFLLPLQVVL